MRAKNKEHKWEKEKIELTINTARNKQFIGR